MGADSPPTWTGSPLAWTGSPLANVNGGSPASWSGSPKAWSAQQGQERQEPGSDVTMDEDGGVPASSSPRTVPAMKCVNTAGEPVYCSAIGARHAPARQFRDANGLVAQGSPAADDFSSCVSLSPSADDNWCRTSCAAGSCPATVCQCGDAPPSLDLVAPEEPQAAWLPAAKASCKSLHSERLTDDWCDQVCLAADGSHIATDGGCDPDYCDCPWEQAPSTPAEPVVVRRDGSIVRGRATPSSTTP